ncbi:MAG: prepilin-type N-terminal cleavage/methylation domain-containing protein [Candidatus Gracilibacteria bacterium]|jgi:prepilin-type N-terminal cleavage/methylation domain-containing protein
MKKGFTLIELLIVIVIIGILAVAFLPSIMNAPAKARDATRQSVVNNIAGIFATKDLNAGLTYVTTGTPLCVIASNTTGVSGLLVPADFDTGVFPSDPKAANVTGGCTGGFEVIVSGASPYKYAVGSTTEVAANANAACSATGIDFSAATKNCFAAVYAK